MKPMKTEVSNGKRWQLVGISLLYLAIFLTIMALAYTNSIPPQLGLIPYSDKIGHGVLYGIAAYLGHRILRYRYFSVRGWILPLFALLFGLFTLVEEVIQVLSPYRTLDMGDLICSFGGIVLGTWLAERQRRR